MSRWSEACSFATRAVLTVSRSLCRQGAPWVAVVAGSVAVTSAASAAPLLDDSLVDTLQQAFARHVPRRIEVRVLGGATETVTAPPLPPRRLSDEELLRDEPPPEVTDIIRPRAFRPTVRHADLSTTISIEDPSGRALAPLHAALRRAERGEGVARLLFYGASFTASDLYPGFLRALLRERFGDAGPGFVLPAHPFSHYKHSAFDIESEGEWNGLRARGRREGVFGLAGFAIESNSAAIARIKTKEGEAVTRFTIYYWKQRTGGRFDVYIDGERVDRRVSARGAPETAYLTYDVEEGPHTLEIRTLGTGAVRIFGVNTERSRPGIQLDGLGIPGARASHLLRGRLSVQTEHAARRGYDLVALAYGTNESADRGHIRHYRRTLRAVVQRAKAVAPEAACLLIGPAAWPIRQPDGSMGPRPRMAEVIAHQREVAREFGCGFFNLREFIGGEDNMVEWVENNLALHDHVHFTRGGHRLFARALEHALLENY